TGATPADIIAPLEKSLYDITAERFNGHLATGLVGIPVLTEWVIKANRPDFMYNMLKKRDYPGYLYMVDNGATATWEHWNGERSHIHNCYNGIGSWFYQAIGGIRPLESAAGYRKILIQPQIPAGITWAKTTKETPYGTVAVDWSLDDNNLTINVLVPVGCTASLPLKENVTSCNINGSHLDIPSTHQLTLQSGKYTISCTL
ncbi:MAG: alpha-rhamnosidase, partial [Tannerella sp.]|nr:alpha-rhamnosidase [Tannerella sp.]